MRDKLSQLFCTQKSVCKIDAEIIQGEDLLTESESNEMTNYPENVWNVCASVAVSSENECVPFVQICVHFENSFRLALSFQYHKQCYRLMYLSLPLCTRFDRRKSICS